MTSKFNKNGIITGVADSFCLPCEKYLNINDMYAHITDLSHQKTLQDTCYVEKFKGDCIRKMRIGYYCEVCNIMLHTLAKTAVHIKDEPHINNKNERLMKQLDKGVIVFEDILIETQAWHGLSDGSCLICEIDYTNGSDHMKDVTHILNLIQSKLELCENRFVYRKIDQDSYNCLICNSIVNKVSKNTHCDSPDHKDNYLKCQHNKKTLQAETGNDDLTPGKNENIHCDNKKETNIIAENSPAIKQIALINNTSDKDVDDNDTLISPLEAITKAKEFAKENKLKYKRNNAYCKVCDVTLSSSLKRMKEHVAEASHTENIITLKNINEKLNKVPTHLFISEFVRVQNLITDDTIINNKYCIDKYSFLCLHINDRGAKCYLCDKIFSHANVNQHLGTLKHTEGMRNASVLVNFETDFIREFRQSMYHCGVCNFLAAGMDQLKNHLNSEDHIVKKARSRIVLHQHLSSIREDQEKLRLLHFLTLLQ